MKYLLIALLLASSHAYAALNKWVDSEGKIHYSDEPPPSNVKAEKVRTSSGAAAQEAAVTPASAPAPAKTIFDKEADLKKANKAREEAAQKAAKQEEEAKAKQKSCEQSRSRLQSLQNSPRVITYDASGERSYMDDATRQQNIDEAQAAVSKYCN